MKLFKMFKNKELITNIIVQMSSRAMYRKNNSLHPT